MGDAYWMERAHVHATQFVRQLHNQLIGEIYNLRTMFRYGFDWARQPTEIAPLVYQTEIACKYTYHEPVARALEDKVKITFVVRGNFVYDVNENKFHVSARPTFQIAGIEDENIRVTPIAYEGDTVEVTAPDTTNYERIAKTMAQQIVANQMLVSLFNLLPYLRDIFCFNLAHEWVHKIDESIRRTDVWSDVKSIYTQVGMGEPIRLRFISTHRVDVKDEPLVAVLVTLEGFYEHRDDVLVDLFAQPNLALEMLVKLQHITITPQVSVRDGMVLLHITCVYNVPQLKIVVQDVDEENRVTNKKELVVTPSLHTSVTPMRSALVVHFIAAPGDKAMHPLQVASAHAILQFLHMNARWIIDVIRQLYKVMRHEQAMRRR